MRLADVWRARLVESRRVRPARHAPRPLDAVRQGRGRAPDSRHRCGGRAASRAGRHPADRRAVSAPRATGAGGPRAAALHLRAAGLPLRRRQPPLPVGAGEPALLAEGGGARDTRHPARHVVAAMDRPALLSADAPLRRLAAPAGRCELRALCRPVPGGGRGGRRRPAAALAGGARGDPGGLRPLRPDAAAGVDLPDRFPGGDAGAVFLARRRPRRPRSRAEHRAADHRRHLCLFRPAEAQRELRGQRLSLDRAADHQPHAAGRRRGARARHGRAVPADRLRAGPADTPIPARLADPRRRHARLHPGDAGSARAELERDRLAVDHRHGGVRHPAVRRPAGRHGRADPVAGATRLPGRRAGDLWRAAGAQLLQPLGTRRCRRRSIRATSPTR